MITERLMAVGDWQLRFLPTVPRSVFAELEPFGHVIVTAAPFEGRAVEPSSLLLASRYTGIYRTRPNMLTIGGAGLAAWMGDEDGKGILIEASETHGPSDFETWFPFYVPSTLAANAVTGTVPGTVGPYTNPFGATYRSQLDYIVGLFGAEWRVNHDGTVDGGLADDLYGTVPTAVVTRLGGGRDITVEGIPATVDASIDVEDYTTRVVLSSGVGDGGADLDPPTPYRDLHGDPVVMTRYVVDNNADGLEDVAAAAILATYGTEHLEITLSTDLYDVTGTVRVGANLFVYDPELRLVDVANQIAYRGEIIAPSRVRVTGLSWAVREGMGVYFLRGTDGAVIDLTEWISFETQPSRLEVGAATRTLAGSL